MHLCCSTINLGFAGCAAAEKAKDATRGSELAREQPRGSEVDDPADVHLAKLGAAESANALAEGMASSASSRQRPATSAFAQQPITKDTVRSGGSVASKQPATAALAQQPVHKDLVSSGGSVASKQKTGAAKAGLQDTDADLDDMAADSRYINPDSASSRTGVGRQKPEAESAAAGLRSRVSDIEGLAADPGMSRADSKSMFRNPSTGSPRVYSRDEITDLDAEADSSSEADGQAQTSAKSGLQDMDDDLNEPAASRKSTRPASAKSGLQDLDDDVDEPASVPKSTKPGGASTAASSKPAKPKSRFGAGVDPADLGLQQLEADTGPGEEAEEEAEAGQASILGQQAVRSKPASLSSELQRPQGSAGGASAVSDSRPQASNIAAVSSSLPAEQLDIPASSRASDAILSNQPSDPVPKPHPAGSEPGSTSEVDQLLAGSRETGQQLPRKQPEQPASTSMPVPVVDLPETTLREESAAAHTASTAESTSPGHVADTSPSSKPHGTASESSDSALLHAKPSDPALQSAADSHLIDETAPHLLHASVSNEGHIGMDDSQVSQLSGSTQGLPEAPPAATSGTALADALSAAEENERAAQPELLQSGSGSSSSRDADSISEDDTAPLKTGACSEECKSAVSQI